MSSSYYEYELDNGTSMSSEYSDEYRCAVFVNEVKVAAGEMLKGALVSDTENDGNYPNHACQDWDIKAQENQVYVVFQNKQPFHVRGGSRIPCRRGANPS